MCHTYLFYADEDWSRYGMTTTGESLQMQLFVLVIKHVFMFNL